MTRFDLHTFVSRHKLGVLSTVADDGAPQSALMGIAVTVDFEIVFDTVSSSRKYSNLAHNPSCSFVIGCEGEQTVQYEGTAEELNGAALEDYKKIYFGAWPDGESRETWPGIVYFVVRPTWIRHSDYSRNPPAIEEFRF